MRLIHILPRILSVVLLGVCLTDAATFAQSSSAGQTQGGTSAGSPQYDNRRTGTNVGQVPNARQGPPRALGGDNTCATAEAIAGTGLFDFDNSAATADGPANNACLFLGQSGLDNDVWFLWTAGSSGMTTIETCALTAVDTKLAVYDGGACPTNATVPLDCNDDSCGLQSSVQFDAVAGTDYYIRVGTFPGTAGGTGQFQISAAAPPPANDDCGSATPLAVPSTTGGTTIGATLDAGAPSPCDGVAITAPGVWYAVLGDGNELTASLCSLNTTYDTTLHVFCGSCSDLVCVAADEDSCANPATGSEVTWCSTQGATYLILVSGAGAAVGDFELSLSSGAACMPTVACPLCPAAASCQDPDRVTWAEADETDAPGVDTAENFRLTAPGVLSSVCWYGGYLDTLNGGPCLDADDFTITYYNDDGGGFVPGTLAAGPFSGANLMNFSRTPTGETIDAGGEALDEYVYSVEHPPLNVFANECYWIEIRNQTAANDCVWVWESAAPGDGISHRFGPQLGDLSFCLDVPFTNDGCQPLQNDVCADAIEITGVGNFPFNLALAGQGGAAACAMDNDVWYCWESVCEGMVTITTCDLTTVDTTIAVYDPAGSGCGCNALAGVLVACSDTGPCGVQAEVSFMAQQGENYMIRIGSTAGMPPGVGLFNIDCECPTDTRPQPGSLIVWPEFQAMPGTKTVLTVSNMNCQTDGIPPLDDDFQRFEDIDVHIVFRTGQNCTAAQLVPPCCQEFNDEFRLTTCDSYTLIVDETYLPGMPEGYVYAYAQRIADGAPVTFNHLIGDLVVADGTNASMYRVKPFIYRGLTQPGNATDIGPADGQLNLNGIEYERITDEYIIPRFFGDRPEAAQMVGISNEIVLVALSGAPTDVTTVRAFLYLDDDPGVDMTRQYRFRCWARLPFNITQADFAGGNPVDFDLMQMRQAGWARVDGDIQSPPAGPDVLDPAFVMMFIERQTLGGDYSESASRPFEVCDRQADNADALSYP